MGSGWDALVDNVDRSCRDLLTGALTPEGLLHKLEIAQDYIGQMIIRVKRDMEHE